MLDAAIALTHPASSTPNQPVAGTTIAIIGGGFSGTMLAIHLVRRCPSATRVILIERSHQHGRGLAYSTTHADHVLNVPAGKMSAFPDQPSDFLHWLQRLPPEALGGVRP